MRVQTLIIVLPLAIGWSGATAWAAESPARGSSRFHVGGRVQRPDPSTLSAYPDAEPHYHNGQAVICSDCHITHASQSHAYSEGAPGPGEQVPYAGGANPNLLKASDPLDLCLACHDGNTFAPDVLGGDANGLTERSGGHFANPGEINPRGHDLGRSLPPAPDDYCYRCHFSGTDHMQVTCIDCHDPHGNGVARNLQWASWPQGTPDLGLFSNPGALGMTRYERSNVTYGSLNTDALREPTSICLDCHHVFSGGWYIDGDSDGIHNRHPTYDSERSSTNNIAQGAADGGSNPAHWAAGAGSGFATTPRVRFINSGASSYSAGLLVDPSTNGVLCLTCHKAHGSDRAFGLTWDITTQGYSAPGCDQCHLIANVPTSP